MSSIVIAGDTSGSVTLAAPAVAGTTTLTLPATSATLATLTTPSFATTIGVGGATASASGSGITFPATQSASSDANTLDDYEEGTWTPVAGGITVNSGTPVYSGTYTKIGRLVYITLVQVGGDITLVGVGSSYFTGLPFTIGATSTSPAVWADSATGKTGTVYAYEGSGTVYILQAISTFTNLLALRITATYKV